MSKSNTFENDLLKLIFNGTAIANIAVNATTLPLGNLYASLHTADPGDAGDQTTSESAYTSYARQAIPRTSAGFTVSGNTATLTSAVTFASATGGTETVTHFGIGTDETGAGKLLYSGVLDDTISVATGVTPQLTTGTTITED